MNKVRSYTAAAALGSMTAAIALLAGISGASAQAVAPGAPLAGAGSFPGSFLVPGTQTSLHVGGVIQLDMRYQITGAGDSPGAYTNAYPATVSLKGTGAPEGATNTQHGVFNMNDQTTRPNVETRTPTPYGEVKTYWEIDFGGSTPVPATSPAPQGTSGPCCSNFAQPRLKQAYGTLGPFLIGQTNDNFADLDSLPDVLDAAGIAGGYAAFPGIRYQPQVRYTWLLPNGVSAAAAVEQFESAGFFSATTTGLSAGAGGTASILQVNNWNLSGMGQRLPALTGTARIDQPWGHAGFHVALAQERIQNFGAPATLPGLPVGGHVARWGFMTAFTGHYNTIGSDKITWDINAGHGAAQYNGALSHVEVQTEEGLVCSAVGASSYQCSEPWVYGVEAGYSHFWTDTWRSGVDFGYDRISRPNAAGGWSFASTTTGASSLASLDKRHMAVHANIQWAPVPQVNLGLEWHTYWRTVQSGAHGVNHAIAGQALFKF